MVTASRLNQMRNALITKAGQDQALIMKASQKDVETVYSIWVSQGRPSNLVSAFNPSSQGAPSPAPFNPAISMPITGAIRSGGKPIPASKPQKSKKSDDPKPSAQPAKEPEKKTEPQEPEAFEPVVSQPSDSAGRTTGDDNFDPNKHLISPTAKDIQKYIDRPEMMSKLDFFYKRQIAKGKPPMPVLLMGDAGSGKTSLITKYAYDNKLPFLAISADSALSVRELFGTIHIKGAMSNFVMGDFCKLIQYKSCILIDEVTALDPAKNFVFHQILASRRFFVKDVLNKDGSLGAWISVHPQCFLVFAGNPPNKRYIGAGKLNIAFADRMGCIEVPSLTEAQLREVFKGQVPADKLDILIRYWGEIRGLIKSKDLRAQFSFRSLERIMSLMNLGVPDRVAVEDAFINMVRAFDPSAGDEIDKLTNTYWAKTVTP